MPEINSTTTGLADQVEFRALRIEDLPAVRHMNRGLARTFAHYLATSEESTAIEAYYTSSSHCDSLLGEGGVGAWLDDYLVGYAAWDPSDDKEETLRVRVVCVDPMFAGCGLGTHIVSEIERIGVQKGYRRFTARALPHLIGFFESLDYQVSARGTIAPGGTNSIPVVFLRKDHAPVRRLQSSHASGELHPIPA